MYLWAVGANLRVRPSLMALGLGGIYRNQFPEIPPFPFTKGGSGRTTVRNLNEIMKLNRLFLYRSRFRKQRRGIF